MDDEVMIALLRGGVREGLDCRVGFYRSGDLRAWTLDEALCGLRIGPRYGSPNYAVGVARGTLWVAAAARGEGDRTTIELFRFDEEGSEWVRVEAPSGQWGELPAEGGRLWLFPTSSRDPYPLELVFTDTEGHLQIRRP